MLGAISGLVFPRGKRKRYGVYRAFARGMSTKYKARLLRLTPLRKSLDKLDDVIAVRQRHDAQKRHYSTVFNA